MNKIKLLLGLTSILLSTILFAQQEAVLKLDTKGHTSLVKDVIVTKLGDIITASDDKTIRIWDAKGKQKRKILGQLDGNSGEILAIALSNDEKYLAVGGALSTNEEIGSSIRLYNYETGKLLKLLQSHTNAVLDLAFSKDDKYLISGSGDKTAKIWDVQNDFLLKETLKFHENYVYAVAIFIKNNQHFSVSAGHDNKVVLYNITKSKVEQTVNSEYNINSIAVTNSNDEGNIAICGASNEIRIFDYDLEDVRDISLETNPWGLSYSKDNNYLISGTSSLPHKVNIFNVQNDYSTKAEFLKHNNLVMSVGFYDEQTAISIGGNNKEIYLWDITSTDGNRVVSGRSWCSCLVCRDKWR
jgi:WD40 repeat protein